MKSLHFWGRLEFKSTSSYLRRFYIGFRLDQEISEQNLNRGYPNLNGLRNATMGVIFVPISRHPSRIKSDFFPHQVFIIFFIDVEYIAPVYRKQSEAKFEQDYNSRF